MRAPTNPWIPRRWEVRADANVKQVKRIDKGSYLPGGPRKADPNSSAGFVFYCPHTHDYIVASRNGFAPESEVHAMRRIVCYATLPTKAAAVVYVLSGG